MIKFENIKHFMNMVASLSLCPDQLKPTLVQVEQGDDQFIIATISYGSWSIETTGVDFVPFLRLDISELAIDAVTEILVNFINDKLIQFSTQLSDEDQQFYNTFSDMFILKFG
jgi:hypothetical protein